MYLEENRIYGKANSADGETELTRIAAKFAGRLKTLPVQNDGIFAEFVAAVAKTA